MDKYVSRDLQHMICKELEGIAKKKELDTPATVEILKELTSSLKNLMKIDKMNMEMEEDPSMRGYSQRSTGRYYVDGTYGTDRGYYDSDNPYRISKMYPLYMEGGYSKKSESKEEIIKELHKLMAEAPDEQIKQSIIEILNKMS